jgi:hypothetical protein
VIDMVFVVEVKEPDSHDATESTYISPVGDSNALDQSSYSSVHLDSNSYFPFDKAWKVPPQTADI